MKNSNGVSAAATRDNRADKEKKPQDPLAEAEREIKRHSAGLTLAIEKRERLLAHAE